MQYKNPINKINSYNYYLDFFIFPLNLYKIKYFVIDCFIL